MLSVTLTMLKIGLLVNIAKKLFPSFRMREGIAHFRNSPIFVPQKTILLFSVELWLRGQSAPSLGVTSNSTKRPLSFNWMVGPQPMFCFSPCHCLFFVSDVVSWKLLDIAKFTLNKSEMEVALRH